MGVGAKRRMGGRKALWWTIVLCGCDCVVFASFISWMGEGGDGKREISLERLTNCAEWNMCCFAFCFWFNGWTIPRCEAYFFFFGVCCSLVFLLVLLLLYFATRRFTFSVGSSVPDCQFWGGAVAENLFLQRCTRDPCSLSNRASRAFSALVP